MNRSREDKKNNLPRIQSHNRIRTSQTNYNERKETQHETYANTNRVQFHASKATSRNNMTTRRAASSAKPSEAFRNEATGAVYAKKIEQMERNNLILTKEIRQIE